MKKLVIGFVIFCVTVIGILPFLVSEKFSNTLIVASGLISSVSALLTLLIAVLLYSKFGIEKNITEKQTETVLRLLIELKKTVFIIQSEGTWLQIYLDNLKCSTWTPYYSQYLIFGKSYYDAGLKNIYNFSEDIYLPVEIVDAMRPFKVVMITHKNVEKYMRVTCFGHGMIDEEHAFGTINNKEATLKEFLDYWSSVIGKSEEWLKKHSSESVNLNFRTKDF